MVICCLAIIAGCSRTKQCEKEIYLLPEGIRGEFVVYFGNENGQPIEYEDSTRIYRIPSSGYLLSQFPKNGGCMSDERVHFYYVDSLGNRTLIEYYLNLDKDSIPQDQDIVLFTFLSEKGTKPEFVINLIGKPKEYKEVLLKFKTFNPVRILDSISNK